jgi:hypothetical protein
VAVISQGFRPSSRRTHAAHLLRNLLDFGTPPNILSFSLLVSEFASIGCACQISRGPASRVAALVLFELCGSRSSRRGLTIAACM